jgi:hypothetical protein
MITIEVTEQSQRALAIKLDRAKDGVRRGLSKGIEAAALSLTSHIKVDLLSGQLVGRRSGNLSRSIFSKMESETSAVVYVGKEAPYGKFVNDGTAAHVITAVNVKALHFYIGGREIFAKSVNHPGTKPTHFMEEGLASWRTEIVRIIGNYVNRGARTGTAE